jgi:peptide/nickel transport system permease protein
MTADPASKALHPLWQASFFRNRLAVLGAMAVLLLLVMAVAAPLLANHDPLAQDLTQSLAAPSMEHWLGTDKQGRDIWSRIVYGVRPALGGALIVVLLSGAIGIPLGLIAGYYRGRVDSWIMRCLDMVLSFPPLLLAILIVATFGRSLVNATIALGIVYVPALARLVRGVALIQRQQTYIEAAAAVGFDDQRILFRHLLPNLMSPILVQSFVNLAYAILDLAALSFLGLGVQPPTPDWGAMLAEGRTYLLLSPYPALSAGIAIMIAVIAFNLLGDGLQLQFDPHQHEE